MWGNPAIRENSGTFSGEMNVDQVWALEEAFYPTGQRIKNTYQIRQTYLKEEYPEFKGVTFGLSKWGWEREAVGVTPVGDSSTGEDLWVIESVYDIEIGWQLLFQFDNQDENDTTVAFEYTSGFSVLESSDNVHQVSITTLNQIPSYPKKMTVSDTLSIKHLIRGHWNDFCRMQIQRFSIQSFSGQIEKKHLHKILSLQG